MRHILWSWDVVQVMNQTFRGKVLEWNPGGISIYLLRLQPAWCYFCPILAKNPIPFTFINAVILHIRRNRIITIFLLWSRSVFSIVYRLEVSDHLSHLGALSSSALDTSVLDLVCYCSDTLRSESLSAVWLCSVSAVWSLPFCWRPRASACVCVLECFHRESLEWWRMYIVFSL